jgi:hypothetical protein
MARELRDKVDPIFAGLTHPPCFCGGDFETCKFHLENDRRVMGVDPFPPCPLWLRENGLISTSPMWDGNDVPWNLDTMDQMIDSYAPLWGMDPVDLKESL